MRSFFVRLLGIFLTLFSAASLLISLYIIMQIWKSKNVVVEDLRSTAANAGDLLEETSQTLEALDSITNKVSRYISATQNSLLTVAQSTHDTSFFLTPVITLTGETLPDLISSTQDSVASSKDTAQLIDGIMNAIAKVPFINQPYNPQKSLTASLDQLSADLERFDPQLLAIESGLKKSQSNLAVIEKQVTDFAQSLDSTIDELNQVKAIVKRYQDHVKKLQDGLAAFEKRIPQMVLGAAMGAIFLVFWMAIFQVYLCYKGLRIFFHPQPRLQTPPNPTA